MIQGVAPVWRRDTVFATGRREAGRSSVTRASVLRALIGEKMALQNTLEVVSQVRSRIGSMRLDNLWDFE